MSNRFWAAAGSVLLVAASSGLIACKGGSTVTYNLVERLLFPTSADAIATPVSDSWHDPTGSSINPARMDHISSAEFRVFRARDGAGIVAFTERHEDLYLAYYGPSGALQQPVQIYGDFYGFPSFLDPMICVWTPQGDAVIAFVANQDNEPTDPSDVLSPRVYYTTFRRSLAGIREAASGEEHGFVTMATPIDANQVGVDDNGISALFVATDLIDGSLHFRRTHPLISLPTPDVVSGDPGDAVGDHGGHFIFLGWVHQNADAKRRAEGAFVDLDRASTSYLELGALQTVPSSPDLDAAEELDIDVLTSGRDMLFRWTDTTTTPSVTNQDRLSLVRVNAARDGLEPAIEVGRGALDSGRTSTIGDLDATTFMGDGYRALNGQRATWLFFTETGFSNGSTVTNTDKDLVIARVDDDGVVEISEFDHQGATSGLAANDATLEACLVGRGASRAVLLYTQTSVATTSTTDDSTSLFARAVYLDGSAVGSTWPNVVSDEVRINGVGSVTTTASAPDVTQVWTAAVEPYCLPQHNNDAFYVAFAQQVEGLSDKKALRYARLEVTVPADVAASGGKVGLTAAESLIEGQLDTGWGATLKRVALAEAGAADGAVVYYSANGNNRGDNAGGVDEHRVYAWAERLPDAGTGAPALPPTEVSSIAAGLPADWSQVRRLWELHVTPLVAASRDFALDTDTAPAEFAHLLLREGDLDTGSPTVVRGRALDLRNGVSTSSTERFFPRPDEEPEMVSSGRHGGTSGLWFVRSVLFSGNALVATFAENAEGETDESAPRKTGGQLFVNTFGPATRSWSDAALLSNESREDLFSTHGEWVALIPGTRSGCPDALGGWAFWVKSPMADSDEDDDEEKSLATYIQGRRFTGVALPAR